MSHKRNAVTVVIFLFCAAAITGFAFWSSGAAWPFIENNSQERHRTRIIIPTVPGAEDEQSLLLEQMVYDDSYSLKAPLENGELAITVLNIDFDNDSIEEQLVVFRNLVNAENPVFITLLGYDERSKAYRRLWNAPVAATMPGTVSLYTQDILGDRSFCVIITGMNAQGEHTMTVFRKDPPEDKSRPFPVIAEIAIDGSIAIQETERPLAYQQGIARGQPFTIAVQGHDGNSENMLDRIEITYSFVTARGVYEQSRVTRVPGSQVEAHRLREILTGEPKVLEEFIFDLWYHVTPQGTIDRSQYLYFDPSKREIIFFGDGTQQVFNWLNSNPWRYGLYISTQNISVTTLRRFLDIEIESLDKIRLKVFEDIRLKIGVSAPWDGSYRRAGNSMRNQAEGKNVRPYTDAVYDSSMGRLRFHANGEYELSSSGTRTKGRYAFFRVGNHDLLELRPERGGGNSANSGSQGDDRLTYSLTAMENPENLSLSRVRLGASGIQELHDIPVILTRAQ
jgi:hypothetical protein